MLTTWTRKLCPLITLAIATIGCGKKINEENSSSTRPVRQNVNLPSTYMIQLDGSKVSRNNYTLPAATTFELPDRIKVKRGNPIGKTVEIAHNISPYDGDDYDFMCTYKSTGSTSEMTLQKCVTFDGEYRDVDYYSPHLLDENEVIQIRFTGASALDLVVEAFYSMDWQVEN